MIELKQDITFRNTAWGNLREVCWYDNEFGTSIILQNTGYVL